MLTYRAIVFFLVISVSAFSQSFEKDYQPIKSSGTIPDDFTFSTKKKIKEDLTKIEVVNTNAKENREYTILTNYAIAQQLHGGNVLINDELTAYVNSVADELLKSDPELRGKIKLFVTKVPETNAFCMGKGYIFIDIGLLSQISSEAQLAAVLAHEISHFTQNHNLKTYIEIKKLFKEKRKKQTFEDRYLRYFRFSKENETEADTLGFKLYRKTNYALSELVPLFDVLKYSYLPFDEMKFDSTFFNDNYYKIPSKYFLSKTLAIKTKEDYDDTKSTHPNIKKRKESVDSALANVDRKQGKRFLVSESEFYKVRDIARFECCRLSLVERNYFQSMISAYILLKKYPENLYLHKIISKSLFGMTLYKTGDLKYDNDSYRQGPIPDFTKTEGYSQQLNFFLDKLPPSEFAILALRYNLMCKQKYANESTFDYYSDTLISMLPTKFGLTIRDFANDSISPTYYKNAFYTLLKTNPEFKMQFEKVSADYKPTESVGAFKVYDPNAKKAKKVKAKESAVPEISSLNINKILIVDPYYKKIDSREPETYMYGVSDTKEAEFVKTILKVAEKNKIACSVIDPGNFSATDIDDFNFYSVLEEWSNERFDGGTDQCNYVFSTDEAAAIKQKYGTQYCLWIGTISFVAKGDGLLATPVFRTIYDAWLMDIETGRIVFSMDIDADVSAAAYVNDLVAETFKAIKKK